VLWTIVRVTGELDYATQAELADCLFRLIAKGGEPRICVDVGRVNFCDSSGMACLVVAAKVAKARGARSSCSGRPRIWPASSRSSAWRPCSRSSTTFP